MRQSVRLVLVVVFALLLATPFLIRRFHRAPGAAASPGGVNALAHAGSS
jgi:hypothetical protein